MIEFVANPRYSALMTAVIAFVLAFHPLAAARPTDAEAMSLGVAKIVAMQEKGPGAEIAAEWPPL